MLKAVTELELSTAVTQRVKSPVNAFQHLLKELDLEKYVNSKLTLNEVLELGLDHVHHDQARETGLDHVHHDQARETGLDHVHHDQARETGLDNVHHDQARETGLDHVHHDQARETGLDHVHHDQARETGLDHVHHDQARETGLDNVHHDQARVTGLDNVHHDQARVTGLDHVHHDQARETGLDHVHHDQPQAKEEIPWIYLKKLMALNSTAREMASDIHPLDVLCVLLQCADSFLQQEIVTKMSMCQFAVPLLLPPTIGPNNTLMLWTMRGIVKRWKTHVKESSKKLIEENIVYIPMPVFSFVRLGKVKLSKSMLLNNLLSSRAQNHDFFIHENLEGGNVEKKVSKGLIEMSWYFPCGKSDVFPEPVAVTNLRGDLGSNWEQFTFLTRISSAVFIFVDRVPTEAETRRLPTGTNYYYVVTQFEESHKAKWDNFMSTFRIDQSNVIIKDRRTNLSQMVQVMRKTMMSLSTKQITIKNMAYKISGLPICIDEQSEECSRARRYAEELTQDIAVVEKYKEKAMALQGKLWKQLSATEKELCRMSRQGDRSMQDYQSELMDKQASIRQQQSETTMHKSIERFIAATTGLPAAERRYFLKWLQEELSSLARRDILALQVKYNETCLKINDLELKNQTLERCRTELKELDQKISNSSLGLEHFLREMGQIYEAERAMQNRGLMNMNRRSADSFPGTAADLLLDGFPLELIDGDVSNIPIQWIKDVLTELDRKTDGRCRMRVISVLGVQSTGKSTLLNTMFGLQFPVASGRCTRGAFMTLIKVKKTSREELGCDFVMVIDTEGLRAPELSSLEGSYEHDNELATLVVGLSDITIVNIAMENAAEMQDILQIVVHAFLRMKEIGEKTNCVFVHQNVSDVSAQENNMRDKKKLLEQLNEVTKIAAKMEKRSKVTMFSDVMDYDLERNNLYISGLWQGKPPMASVNVGYSEQVQDLKKYLLEFIKRQKHYRNPSSIPQFCKWIESLWKAVKYETFIFSFRNSLVADAYYRLSMQFSLWEWEFRKKVHSKVNSLQNSIKNQSEEAPDRGAHAELKDLENCIHHEETQMIQSLEKYFEDRLENQNVQLVERYREDFIKSIQSLRRELENNAQVKYREAVAIQRETLAIQNIQNRYQELIEEKITKLLERCRKENYRLGNKDLMKEFNTMWTETLEDQQISHVNKRNVQQSMFYQLKRDMGMKGPLVNERLTSECTLRTSSLIDHYLTEEITNEEDHKLKTLVTLLDQSCEEYVDRVVNRGGDYVDVFCYELLNTINEQLGAKTGNVADYSVEFELEIKIFILHKASQKFQDMHERFNHNNHPRAILERLKPQYLSIFADSFQEKDECQSRAKRFTQLCLKPAIFNYIFQNLGDKIMDDVLLGPNNQTFRNRSFFQSTLLEGLLSDMSFQEYVKYISSYEAYAKDWTSKYISKTYRNSPVLESLQEQVLADIISRIKDILNNEECQESPNLSRFLKIFCGMLRKELVLSTAEIKVLAFHSLMNSKQFSSDVEVFLQDTEQEVRSEMRSMSFESLLSKITLKPQDELLKKAIGCGHQCPFCKVPCEAGSDAHENHFASVHRPRGLGQYRWCKNEKLVADICTTAVVSQSQFKNSDTGWTFHPYKDYRTYYPDWAIQPDPSIESSDYWKYIFVKFNIEFAKMYNAKPAVLPANWKTITKEQASSSLRKVYNLS
ncbi:LOW QUALITY PROTEIN: interferon-induced very large GTPase 1-like [Bufo gargarizans]|uniref:LOW QUALITY PROTEIN: interferon-induced very large GTPase 1-like n=1 Tax=Bufo gargarizans TaxID=30331 RepID=UPI001CF3053C|nr:LOW QUALITY PROTEIN: interferon-induced very large GTPase 1-like [Bufo gargarizans]